MRRDLRCDVCRDSPRPGLLPMGTKDWILCPQCGGSKKIVMYEERIQPPPTRVFLAGLKGV